jgi:hypothetical protein
MASCEVPEISQPGYSSSNPEKQWMNRVFRLSRVFSYSRTCRCSKGHCKQTAGGLSGYFRSSYDSWHMRPHAGACDCAQVARRHIRPRAGRTQAHTTARRSHAGTYDRAQVARRHIRPAHGRATRTWACDPHKPDMEGFCGVALIPAPSFPI